MLKLWQGLPSGERRILPGTNRDCCRVAGMMAFQGGLDLFSRRALPYALAAPELFAIPG